MAGYLLSILACSRRLGAVTWPIRSTSSNTTWRASRLLPGATLAWIFPNGRFTGYPQEVARAALAPLYDAAVAAVVCSNVLAVPVGIAIYRHTAYAAAARRGSERAVGRYQLRTGGGGPATYADGATAAACAVSLPCAAAGRTRLCESLRVHGTIDNLSEHGMRFYGGLPPYIESGSEFSGRLTLPDGPLRFTGRVRTLIALEGHPGMFKAFGGMFNAKPGDQKRIDHFLFGSDLQWVVNGYSDQVDTPFGRLIPGHVPRARRPPVLDTHWNAGELTGMNGETFQVVLSFSKTDRTQSGWLLSFTQVPENQTLRLDSFRRTDVAPQMERYACGAWAAAGRFDPPRSSTV